MTSILMFVYGLFSYATFLASFLYLIAFVGDLPVPKNIDSGVSGATTLSVVVNAALLGLFAIQHSVMARPAFKRLWTRIVPVAVERSTYVLAASATLDLVLWQWRPMPEPLVWSVTSPAAVVVVQTLFWIGWAVVLTSSYLINHFELFGLSQVYHRLMSRVPKAEPFRTPLLYRHVRHPLYLGFVIAMWATTRMTAGHLLFAVGMTAYILAGIHFEERDLVRQFGEGYLRYRERVGMLLPRLTRK